MSKLKSESTSALDELKTRAGNQGAKLEGLSEEPQGLFDRLKSAVSDKIASVKDKFSSPEPFDAGKEASKLQQQAFDRDPEDLSSDLTSGPSRSIKDVLPQSGDLEAISKEAEGVGQKAIASVQDTASSLAKEAEGVGQKALASVQDTANTQIAQGKETVANLSDIGNDAKSALQNTATQMQQEGTTAISNAESGLRDVAGNIESKGSELVNAGQDLAKSTINDATSVGSNIAKEGSTLLDEGIATGAESISEVLGPVGDAIDAGLLLWQTFSGLKDILHQPTVITAPTATFQAGI
jgi:uncharacterized phage infection (PIP) family protein YhgE